MAGRFFSRLPGDSFVGLIFIFTALQPVTHSEHARRGWGEGLLSGYYSVLLRPLQSLALLVGSWSSSTQLLQYLKILTFTVSVVTLLKSEVLERSMTGIRKHHPPSELEIFRPYNFKENLQLPSVVEKRLQGVLGAIPLLCLPQRQNGPCKVSIDVTLLNFFPSLREGLCFYECELIISTLSISLEKVPVASIRRCPVPSLPLLLLSLYFFYPIRMCCMLSPQYPEFHLFSTFSLIWGSF